MYTFYFFYGRWTAYISAKWLCRTRMGLSSAGNNIISHAIMHCRFSLYLFVLLLLLLYVLYSLCQQIKSMFTLRLSSAVVTSPFSKRIGVNECNYSKKNHTHINFIIYNILYSTSCNKNGKMRVYKV